MLESIFFQIINIISNSIDRTQNGGNGERILIQGKAGTGKSFLIKMVSLLTRAKFQEVNAAPILRCAPTGVAASGIHGDTIHRLFAIPPQVHSSAYMENLSAEVKTKLKTDLRKIKLLVIDEISMVGINRWMQVDQALRWAYETGELFGGITCLFTGDFNQIPPVGDTSITDHLFLLQEFAIVELYEGMRQRNYPKFQEALNNFAEGSCSNDDVELLNSLEDHSSENWAQLGEALLAVYHLNNKVDEINRNIIALCFRDKIKYYAIYKFEGFMPERGPVQAQYELILSVGARVICLVNLDVRRGLTNGAIGKVISCKKRYILCQFNKKTFKIRRYRWTNIGGFSQFVQFPLRLAFGITSFKVQGKTFHDLVVRVDGKGEKQY